MFSKSIEYTTRSPPTPYAPPITSRPPDPLAKSSMFQFLTWSWPYPLLSKGWSRPLTESDLPHISPQNSSTCLADSFQAAWNSEKNKPTPSLHRGLLKHYWTSGIYWLNLVVAVEEALRVFQALALGWLLQHFAEAESTPSDASPAWQYSTMIIGASLINLFLHHIYYFYTWLYGMQYKNGCISTIYQKSLSMKAGQPQITGRIMSLTTNDSDRFMLASIFIPYLIWGPAEAIFVGFYGYYRLGPSFLIGYSLLIPFVYFQFLLSDKFKTVRNNVATVTDARVGLLSQAVVGVRLMKMSGWENNFMQRIADIRHAEVAAIWGGRKLNAYNEALFFSCNVVISAVIFTSKLYLTDTPLTSADVFVTMTLINIVQFCMTKFFSLGVQGCSELYVSLNRIQEFLELPDFAPSPHADYDSTSPPIVVKDLTTHWGDDPASPTPALSNLNLTIAPNTLTCVVGPVGAGKSAFLLALLREFTPTAGSVAINGTVSYAAQQPFILSTTVQENILFGQPFNKKKYREINAAVGLDVDFERLADGDQTMIGDRGVNLSGGQRARIGLARAIYSDSNIILLDDVLSAVDVSVGKLIFQKAILGLLIEKKKATVVLVTHQHSFCFEPEVTNCLLLVDGKIVHVGDYTECVKKSGGKLSLAAADDSPQNDKSTLLRADSFSASSTCVSATSDGGGAEADLNADAIEMNEFEEAATDGKVTMRTWVAFARAMGDGSLFAFFAAVLLMGGGQALLVMTTATLGKWSEETDPKSVIVLVWCLVGGTVAISGFRTLFTLSLFMGAARRLHDSMTNRVLRSKISFFDTHPLGIILNRFSADVDICDNNLATTLYDTIMCSLMCLGAVITASFVLPLILVAIPPLMWYFLRLRRVYLASSREIKRIDGVTRSPVFSMIGESLSGLVTIRAFEGAQDHFKHLFEERHDSNLRAFFAFLACSRWIGFRLDAICVILLGVACWVSVVFFHYTTWELDPAVLGLALMLLIQLAALFQWSVRQSAESENLMISVERVLEFCDLPVERALEGGEADVSGDWPMEGAVTFKGVTARYRKQLDPSLDDFSVVIEGGSKVGVVGRTGSGKSTMLQVLFDLLDEVEGDVEIDGVNIRDVGLHEFRRKIAVIPQTPTLFNGSLRKNLDPFQDYGDSELWEALETVQMREEVPDLDMEVADGGSNFSVGQKQLLCLARAVLSKCKILVLDEPSANVDMLTDERLQKAIGKVYGNSTIISIAHRLDTIIGYDKVLVVGDGAVLEYGAPAALLRKERGAAGHFDGMVREVGGVAEQMLREKANEKERRDKHSK